MAGDSKSELVAGDRAAIGRIELHRAEVACLDGGIAFRRESRAFGDDVDGAAGGVAAIECALRAPENFHAVKVKEGGELGKRGADIDAIGIEADAAGRGGVEVVEAGAADEDLRVCGGIGGGDAQAGDEVVERGDVGNALFFQR